VYFGKTSYTWEVGGGGCFIFICFHFYYLLTKRVLIFKKYLTCFLNECVGSLL
jgi:hypothetical protein